MLPRRHIGHRGSTNTASDHPGHRSERQINCLYPAIMPAMPSDPYQMLQLKGSTVETFGEGVWSRPNDRCRSARRRSDRDRPRATTVRSWSNTAGPCLIATRIGAFRPVVCASPALLEKRGIPGTPADLADMPCVRFNGPMFSPDWSFRCPDTGRLVILPISPRLQVSSPDAAVDAAIRGLGFTQLLHYHVAEAVDAGKLEIVLDSFELDPVPIQLVHASRNMMPLKLRRFLDFATPRFRESLSRFARQT